MAGYLLLGGVLFLLGMFVSSTLKRKFKEYGEQPLMNGMSGREVAEKMLHDNGIYDVKVVSVDGFLSDHYNPTNKTVNLSPEVYQGRSIASAAVAAHECGSTRNGL
jgi:Zn-dependent membrane protease YugP